MKQELWTSGKDVSMAKILDARENRVQIQQEMLQKSPSCLLSFTLNIPGPVKVFPYTKWTYEVGISIILKGISLLNGVIIEQKEVKKDTGWEAFFALNLHPEDMKSYLLEQEEQHPLGRLFDFDILRADGSKLSRQELGFLERTCLLCGNPAVPEHIAHKSFLQKRLKSWKISLFFDYPITLDCSCKKRFFMKSIHP